MKFKWSLWVRDAAPWLLLLLLSDCFFIFLAWLVFPDVFPILAGLMVVFTLGSAAAGIWFMAQKRRKQEDAFRLFLAEPSVKHERDLADVCGDSYKNLIHEAGECLREQQRLVGEYGHQFQWFEEFIEAWIHEIKTPLSLVTLLLINRRDEMSEQVYRKIEHARREIGEEVDRILYYARSQSDHIDYRFERISLSDCCSEVLEDLDSLFEERGATVCHDFHDVEVVSDLKTLQFIITQIILNSIKYVEAGRNPVIRLEAGVDTEKTRCFLKISDNGIGVPMADLPFIFDKGFTGNHPEHRKATGMGLYLVRKFCEGLQIDIEVDSRVGQGTTVSLIFPVVEVG